MVERLFHRAGGSGAGGAGERTLTAVGAPATSSAGAGAEAGAARDRSPLGGGAAVATSAAQPHPHFVLLDHFRDFYSALTRERRRILTGSAAASAGAPAAGGTGGAAEGAPAAAAPAGSGGPWQALLALLQAQGRAASQAGAGASWGEGQLLFAVFADEVFLDLVWPGRAAWAARPLERELCGSGDGRDAVFERLDALLLRGVASDPDLARTYLLALGLGFRGRYRGAEERGHLDAYRAKLVEALYQHGLDGGPAAAEGARALLFPDAYLGTRSQGRRARLPGVRLWTALALSTIVLYAIFSYRVWDRAAAPLAAAVERVLASP